MPRRSLTFVCAPCRTTAKLSVASAPRCPRCRCGMRNMGTRWRAPQQRDDAAWKLLQSGDWATERTATQRHEQAQLARSLAGRWPASSRWSRPGSSWEVQSLTSSVQYGSVSAVQAERRIAEIARSVDPDVRFAVAASTSLPAPVVSRLLRDKDEQVALRALAHATADVPGAELAVRRAARSKSAFARECAACVPMCPPALLSVLAVDRRTAVVRAALANPSLPDSALLAGPAELVSAALAERAWDAWTLTLPAARADLAQEMRETALMLLEQIWPTRVPPGSGAAHQDVIGPADGMDSVAELLAVAAAVIGV